VSFNCFRSVGVCSRVVLFLVCAAASGCANSTTAATTAVAALSSVVLSTSSVLGGTTVTGTVNLSAVAPTGGAVVTLSSSSPAATVPVNVTVPAGNTSQSFVITTTSVAATATITATYSNASQAATLVVTVVTVPMLQGLLLSTSVSAGGLPIQGTITLTSPAPAGGLSVSLASNSALARVPATVTVPLGNISQTFQIDTVDSSIATTAIITASYGGVVQTARFTIGQLALSVALTSVPGGLADIGTVTLPVPAPDGGALIALTSNSPDAIVPASVMVTAGATVQTFTIATVDAPPTTTATITATYAGMSQTATLIVLAYPNVVAMSCTPTSPTGGTTVQCTGTLSSASPAAGWRLSCASSDPSVTPPASVAVPPSSLTFQFSLATTAVSSATVVSVQIFDAQSGLALWGQLITISP
jgi:hypothetical protein